MGGIDGGDGASPYRGMARSVVLKPSPRCPGCRQSLRWCVCAGRRTIETPLQVDVLMGRREQWKPSSTGQLIGRVIAGARQHVWDDERILTAEEVRLPGREIWVLDPRGEPPPAGARPEAVQVMLVDGAWREAATLARAVGGWGRVVGLPMTGASRYWLRTQAEGGRFSTVEALLFVLEWFGLAVEHAELRRQFELHVYAGLRARGNKAGAEEFVRTSPVAAEIAAIVAELDVRRPR